MASSRNIWVAIGAANWAEVRRPVGRLHARSAQQTSYGIGHQDAYHPYFAQLACMYHPPGLLAMVRVVPRATDKKLHPATLRERYKLPSLGRSKCHWLLDERM